MKEIWKTIKGFDRYMVSTKGRVYSSIGKGRILKSRIGKTKYASVVLYSDGEAKRFQLHRLVAQAFLPNPSNKPDINHKNGIKSDNRLENIEWCTKEENMQHAIHTGLLIYDNKGIKNPTSKLTEKDVLGIKNSLLEGRTQVSLSTEYGVSFGLISKIHRNKIWTHI